MTESTYNKIKQHLPTIEMVVVHTNDTGQGYRIINDLIKIQREYTPNPKPVDTSCGNCVLELFKDVYRHYMNYENPISK